VDYVERVFAKALVLGAYLIVLLMDTPGGLADSMRVIIKEILASPFSLPADPNLANYVNAWTDAGIGRYFLNTIVVVGCALFLVMMLGALTAYVLARFSFPGSRAIYHLMLAGLTFPVFLAIVPLFFVLRNAGLLNTLPGLIITYVAFAFPFTVFFLYSFFRSLPHEVAEAAQVDGAGEWRTFFQIMLPMARPGMASVAIFNFLGLWNQFLLPLVLMPDQDRYVLSQGLAVLAANQGYRSDWSALFAGLVIALLPVLAVYIAFQRRIQDGLAVGALK
jgi:N-acetylglucosamine transport system permease protein